MLIYLKKKMYMVIVIDIVLRLCLFDILWFSYNINLKIMFKFFKIYIYFINFIEVYIILNVVY